jgi:multidrug efflux system membrane fusion protein
VLDDRHDFDERNVVRLLLTASALRKDAPMRHRIVISAGLLAVLLAIGGTVAVTRLLPTSLAAATATRQTPPVPVVAATVTQHDVPIYLRGVGTVIAYNTVVVRSQIQGQITQVAFTEGQSIRTGDLLAQIDPRPYQAQIEQITATRDRDQAQLKNAQKNLDRYTQLGAKGWATPQLVDTQTAQVAQLQNAVKADEALIDAANVQLSYTRLTSPIDGVTGIRQIDIGNVIHPTDANGLVVVTQLQPISVIFTLPETDLPQIQQQLAKGPLTVEAYSQDNTIKLDEGKLDFIDNEILQTTGSVRFKAEFPNPAHRLWPGELINVWLLLDTRHDGLTVAAPAVQQGPQGAYVYVIGSDGRAAARPVKVAQVSGGQALIDSGLTANEQVVVDGQYKLQPGARVAILTGNAAGEFAAQSAQQTPIP